MSVETVLAAIQAAKQKLLAVRETRIRPLTDDKSLLSWNALMNIALSRAGIALGQPAYVERAREHMEWMMKHFEKDGEMLRTWKKGVAKIAANLDDKVYLVQALLQLAAASGDNELVLQAARINETIMRDFSHEDGVLFYYTSLEQTDIPVRKVDIYDGATPSANAVMAGNLRILGMCMERSGWLERSGVMLQKMTDTVMRYSYSFGYWATLIQRVVAGFKLVVCAGPFSGLKTKELQGYFLPHSYIVTSEKEISVLPVLENKFLGGKVSIFVCTEQACLAPESETERVLQLIMQQG